MQASPVNTMSQPALARTLALPQLVLMGIGTIVGAGIYSVIGAVAALAGRAMWASLALAGLAAALNALSYSELISARHKAGAEYQFMRAAFPHWPVLAYLTGFFVALHCAATSAAVSLSFAGYLRAHVPAPELPLAWTLLVVCTALNIAGIRESAWAGIALIVLAVGGLLLVTVLGFGYGQPSQALRPVAPGQGHEALAGAALLFFAFIGFENVANLSEESRRPAVDVPRAMLASLFITGVLYLLLVWAVLALLEPHVVAASQAPLAEAAARASPWAGPLVRTAALFATASTALLVLVSITRLVFAMAREGDFPSVLARTSRRRNTPWVAALLLFIGASALLHLREVAVVASVSTLGILIAFSGVHAAVIALRLHPRGPAPAFRIPLSVGALPLPAVLGLGANLMLMTQFTGRVYAVTAATMGAGLLAYAWMRQRRTGSTADPRRAAQGTRPASDPVPEPPGPQ